MEMWKDYDRWKTEELMSGRKMYGKWMLMTGGRKIWKSGKKAIINHFKND